MNKKMMVAATAFACAALFGTAVASAAVPGEASRAELTRAVIQKWSSHVDKAFPIGADAWSVEMAPAFAEASLEELQAAANAKTFDDMNTLLLGGTIGDGTNALGDDSADLVYIPVTPCRILDTRLAGGQIAANTVRGFDVTAVSDYSFQGGSATNCGGVGAAGSFAAAEINFTVVTPSIAGYITAFPFGAAQPLAATVNYSAGAIVGNDVVVKLDQGASANELSVYTFGATHLVGDIVGYYIDPEATPLDCVETATTSTPVAAGATANSVAPSCATGYTQTATNCESSTWQMPFVFVKGGTCSAQNNSASAATLRSSRTCCRVPGR
jgi:hypothetical protein